MDLTDFDSSLLVWGEDVNLADKAIINASVTLPSHDDLVVDGSDVLALLNGDSSNNSTLMPSLLNNFVSAMADQSMSSVALGQSGEGSFQYPFYGGSSETTNYAHIQSQSAMETEPKCLYPGSSNMHQQQQLMPITDLSSSQRSTKLPQHLMINHNSNLKDTYSIQAMTDGTGRTSLQPIFPPNYFWPTGMSPWTPTNNVHKSGEHSVVATSSSLFPSAVITNNSTVDVLDSFYCSTDPMVVTHGESNLHPPNTLHFFHDKQSHLTINPKLMITDTSIQKNHPPMSASHGEPGTTHIHPGEETMIAHQDHHNGIFQVPNNLLLSSFLDAQRWHNSTGSSSFVAPSNSSMGAGPSGDRNLQTKHISTGTSMNHRKNTSDRNEREQRRAQQITELIDELRESMVKAGWKVELKGKYHTLSRCVEYLHHLKKMTKEKEEAIERTKCDLAIRKQKMDEDKASLENRSDPESVVSQISSLTDDDNQMKSESMKKRWSDRNSDTDGHQHLTKKISSESESHHYGSEDGAVSSESGMHTIEGRKNMSIGNMCSSISDITDKSIKSSVNESRPSRLTSHSGAISVKDGEDRDLLETISSSSISSTAAVFSGIGSNDRPSRNVDVSIKHGGDISKHRSRRRAEISSHQKNFVLDYEEVFYESNIPQLIATLSGRVIACNDFFLHCLGLQNICNMTLFRSEL